MGTNSQQLEEQILEDAEKKKDPILRRAQRKAEKIIQEAEKEIEKQRDRMKEEAREQAERETARLQARAELEAENLHRQARENILNTIRQRAENGLRKLTQSDDYPEAMAQLALKSIDAMTGEDFELVLTDEDKTERSEEILDAVEQEIDANLSRDVSVNIAVETAPASGGLIVRRADGSQACDQRFDRRLERLWGELRIHVADVIGDELKKLDNQQQDTDKRRDDTND